MIRAVLALIICNINHNRELILYYLIFVSVY